MPSPGHLRGTTRFSPPPPDPTALQLRPAPTLRAQDAGERAEELGHPLPRRHSRGDSRPPPGPRGFPAGYREQRGLHGTSECLGRGWARIPQRDVTCLSPPRPGVSHTPTPSRVPALVNCPRGPAPTPPTPAPFPIVANLPKLLRRPANHQGDKAPATPPRDGPGLPASRVGAHSSKVTSQPRGGRGRVPRWAGLTPRGRVREAPLATPPPRPPGRKLL
ncbi:putative uncharacterized protein FLJ46214 [Cricetulus griseus]|uniref:Uncharacterized protein n=1 Tax=Cricetulus griseus TaxID=10029 RepID=A0A9J7K1B2_CRIGR|nr:putative uncharacterized protein FLJ46214 [Cricetulus griseus]